MLNRILSILIVLLTIVSVEAKSPEFVPQFKVVSDTFDKDIPAGTCLISGVVTHNDKLVNEAMIKAYHYDSQSGSSKMSLLVNSNKIGKIRMSVDTAVHFLTAWKPGTGTVYVEGVKFKSQHHIVLEIYLPEEEEMIMVEKPVVYLYSENNAKSVEVEVATDDNMVFTYPQMEVGNKWKVNVGPDGLQTLDGKQYPYLFWEASTKRQFYNTSEDKVIGKIIATDTAVQYLENKLFSLHLSPTEVTDFITYWGPRLQQKEYAVIQFKIDKDVNEVAELNISPQPDWVRRVYMVFTGFEQYPTIDVVDAPIIEEGLVKREGFHVVEWGGSEVPMIKL